MMDEPTTPQMIALAGIANAAHREGCTCEFQLDLIEIGPNNFEAHLYHMEGCQLLLKLNRDNN